jgi:hypothetical protein
MQTNALLAWQRFYDAKSGCYTPPYEDIEDLVQKVILLKAELAEARRD